MRVAVCLMLVACPLVIAAGCFGEGGVDAPPPSAGSGSSSSAGGAGGSGGMGVGGMGGAGGVGGASSSSSSSGSGGQGGAGGGASVVACPGKPGMVQVQAPAGGNFYCIDSTEVTSAAYVSWAETMPMLTQPPQCEWNTSLLPQTVPPKSNLPMANVDWCDAYAYCAAHEKRLCGRIDGGPLPFSESAADEALSQWHNVCTAGGTRTYPYGDTYDPVACNGQDKDAADDKPLAVGVTTCEGGFLGIFDLSGNVWEWEDSCDEAEDAGTPAEHNCRRRGGGYSSKQVDMDCSTASTIARASANSQTGFRCCADPSAMP
ncbi:formylglycine-generating enzyme family protein [Polyangium spumosum]|uniref:SUMF1/EgtB/PvdO family nonheme iron enzyme n=1 Tax=Polyangium spumosum TaxID=889282 RepID=A0A6N7PKA9_9BACT|nr:SUMF1/EgtB/PvdO family nonheme iron enzyme [Polyangium spumosum]MRG92369.1 SUMF1/EgtB/PvdO family nonheme iron enzyme [Polyangium spumosum]